MGALAPLSGLLGSTVAGLSSSSGGQSTTPPLDNFFGIDGRFLGSPAGGTALFNNVLFGASNQQVPIDFLGQGYYTGIPPVFGGAGFTGLQARFDMFASNGDGVFGLDRILNLERSINGTGVSGATPATTANPVIAAPAATPAAATDEAADGDQAAAAPAGDTFTRDQLKNMSLGDLLSLLA